MRTAVGMLCALAACVSPNALDLGKDAGQGKADGLDGAGVDGLGSQSPAPDGGGPDASADTPVGDGAGCISGAGCTLPAAPCLMGALLCTGGTAVCVIGDQRQPNGLACGSGPGMVCKDGNCVTCAAGDACVPTNPCHLGTLVCSSGSPQCNDTGNNAPNGVSSACGGGQVCRDGACVACMNGMACTSAPCRLGTISCASGAPECRDNGMKEANGAPCGPLPGHVCREGACVECKQGAVCDSGNPCKTGGTTSCASGLPVCMESNRPNGTGCGATTCSGTTKTERKCQEGTCASVAAGCAPGQCNAAGTDCEACGSLGQHCCGGDTCPGSASVVCVNESTCQACGGADQTCVGACGGNNQICCGRGYGLCGGGLFCRGPSCVAAGSAPCDATSASVCANRGATSSEFRQKINDPANYTYCLCRWSNITREADCPGAGGIWTTADSSFEHNNPGTVPIGQVGSCTTDARNLGAP
jgi:hypothetical protein